MIDTARDFVDSTIQCWGCPVFDRLFEVVSNAAAMVYGRFAMFCTVLLCMLLAFYIVNAIWTNIKSGVSDPWYSKTAQPAVLGAMLAVFLLGLGVAFPRFITSITFEPTAQIALIYSQSMVQTSPEIVNAQVTYTPIELPDTGFFRPQLRDTIIMLMKTTVSQFQAYIKLGLSVMDAAFSWRALISVSALLKHILWFALGLYLSFAFFRLFVRFCMYFADIIVAMSFFAFFFPLSIAMIAFKNASNVPAWISGIGKSMGADQFKKLINSIIALVAALLTYTAIMTILAKFFSSPDASAADLMEKILHGNVFAADLSDDNLESLTLMSVTVLVYIITFLQTQIPQVTQIVLNAFNVGVENKLSEGLADDAMRLTQLAVDNIKKAGSIIMSGGEAKKDDTKKDDAKKGASK